MFICSGNIDRSPTAEKIFNDSAGYKAKSAGTRPTAPRRVAQELINWADTVFVMSEREDKHLTFLREHFNLQGKEIYDLDIPDMYERDDPELIEILKNRIGKYLKFSES